MSNNNSRHKTIPVGSVFSSWTVIGSPFKNTKGEYLYPCRCCCGQISDGVRSFALLHGRSKTCKKCLNSKKVIHNIKDNPLYNVWMKMISRCTDTKDKSYMYYGGKGNRGRHKMDVFEKFYIGYGGKAK